MAQHGRLVAVILEVSDFDRSAALYSGWTSIRVTTGLTIGGRADGTQRSRGEKGPTSISLSIRRKKSLRPGRR